MTPEGPHGSAGARVLPRTARLRVGTLGLAASLCCALFANLFAAKYDHRWDLTHDRRYTPAAPLRQLLRTLPEPVTAVVLLGRGDPLSPTIEQFLESCRNETERLTLDWVDPDRDEGRYLAKQTELGIAEGLSDDGHPTTDALIVLVTKRRKYYLTAESITGLDPDLTDGGASLEHAFAVGLSSLRRARTPKICFTTGHRELTLLDQSPIGLSLLKARLERDALTTATIDPTEEKPEELATCQLLVVASPDVALGPRALEQLSLRVRSGTSLLLLGGVLPQDSGKLSSAGFEPLAALAGVKLEPSLVIEYDDRFRLPNLFGETFFATPAPHPINRSILRGPGDPPLRVVVALAPSLHAVAGSHAEPLLLSSRSSLVVTDVSRLGEQQSTMPAGAPSTSHIVAMAGEVARSAGPPSRLIVAPTNLVQNRTFSAPALVVSQSFTMSLFSWLTAEPEQVVEYVARSSRPRGLELSAEEFQQILRYVLWVMPGAVCLSGLGVYFARRRSGRDLPNLAGKADPLP